MVKLVFEETVSRYPNFIVGGKEIEERDGIILDKLLELNQEYKLKKKIWISNIQRYGKDSREATNAKKNFKETNGILNERLKLFFHGNSRNLPKEYTNFFTPFTKYEYEKK